MPPADKAQIYGTPEGDRVNKIVASWIESIPESVDESYSRVKITEKRNIRMQPSTTATACGQLQEGDIVFVDPRPARIVEADGHKWNRVYLVPAHSRLFKGVCAPPEDGVYYLAR
jgi:hypothetical protein